MSGLAFRTASELIFCLWSSMQKEQHMQKEFYSASLPTKPSLDAVNHTPKVEAIIPIIAPIMLRFMKSMVCMEVPISLLTMYGIDVTIISRWPTGPPTAPPAVPPVIPPINDHIVACCFRTRTNGDGKLVLGSSAAAFRSEYWNPIMADSTTPTHPNARAKRTDVRAHASSRAPKNVPRLDAQNV